MAKDHFVRARVTKWEKNFVHGAAEKAHMSESEFIRRCILVNKLVIWTEKVGHRSCCDAPSG